MGRTDDKHTCIFVYYIVSYGKECLQLAPVFQTGNLHSIYSHKTDASQKTVTSTEAERSHRQTATFIPPPIE